MINYVFKPRARLMLQLGEQLIRNESIAVLELVKNSYDADATNVSVVMEEIEDPEKGTIIIEDDGTGMDIDIIENVWLEPGSDYKEKLRLEKKRTEKYNRTPLGEKGIGRFAVHKLGNLIEVITKKKDQKEIYIRINWADFVKAKYLNDAAVYILEREPEVFTENKTGTRIVIKGFRRPWTRLMIRELYRSINSMCSPFESLDSFHIDFKTDKEEWLKGLLTKKEIEEYALFKFKCEIEGNNIIKFIYDFVPWSTMVSLNSRTVTEKDISRVLKMVTPKGQPIDISPYKIGKVTFEGMIFDRDPEILRQGVQDKRGLKEYLNDNGGVRVYRDGLRIYDYGEPENDWLSLDLRRVNAPPLKISKNLIIAAVSLNGEESIALTEKANREGFIENDAYYTFKESILYTLQIVERLRKADKDKIRSHYGLNPKTEPVLSVINELKTVINAKVNDKELKKEIKKYIDVIEVNYKRINELLLRSAGAGLNLIIVIHEIEKNVDSLIKVVQNENTSNRILSLVKNLSHLIEGYTLIIRKDEKKKWDIKKLINQSIFNTEFRFDSHKIEIIKEYQDFNGNTGVSCARNLIIGTIMNIFDNSIWWLKYEKVKDKKIFISISEDISGHISIIFADNGPGFTIPIENVTEPFVSAKPDGMGIGLYIAKEVMNAHNGKLLFPEWGDFDIPDEFKYGAVVVLAFKKGENIE